MTLATPFHFDLNWRPTPFDSVSLFVCWYASVGQIYSDNCACCHTEIEAADLTQSQYTDTGPTRKWYEKKTLTATAGIEPGSVALEANEVLR